MSEHTVPAAPDSGDDLQPVLLPEWALTYARQAVEDATADLRAEVERQGDTIQGLVESLTDRQRQVDAVKAVHAAYADKGEYGPRCDWSLRWTVPLVGKGGAAHVTCPRCRAALSGGDTPEPPREDLSPSRWWRVLDSDGGLWCETSDQAEALEALTEIDNGRMQRLYVTAKPHQEWRDHAASPDPEKGQS